MGLQRYAILGWHCEAWTLSQSDGYTAVSGLFWQQISHKTENHDANDLLLLFPKKKTKKKFILGVAHAGPVFAQIRYQKGTFLPIFLRTTEL